MVPGSPSFIQGFLHVAAVPGLLPAWKKACCRATSTFILELIRRLPASLAGISEKAIANPTDESSVDNVTFHCNPSSIPRHGRRVGTLPDWLGIASLNRLAASDARPWANPAIHKTPTHNGKLTEYITTRRLYQPSQPCCNTQRVHAQRNKLRNRQINKKHPTNHDQSPEKPGRNHLPPLGNHHRNT